VDKNSRVVFPVPSMRTVGELSSFLAGKSQRARDAPAVPWARVDLRRLVEWC
jgi:hypothetical protein